MARADQPKGDAAQLLFHFRFFLFYNFMIAVCLSCLLFGFNFSFFSSLFLGQSDKRLFYAYVIEKDQGEQREMEEVQTIYSTDYFVSAQFSDGKTDIYRGTAKTY